jgi:hypothetical protein
MDLETVGRNGAEVVNSAEETGGIGAAGNGKRVYIIGPMRGKPDWNRPAFAAAEARWRAAGWTVFSPAYTLSLLDHDPSDDPARPGSRYRQQDRTHLNHALQVDLACIYAADAVAVLPGWQASMGGTVEVALAQFLGLDLYDAETMQAVIPPKTPWAAIDALQTGLSRAWGVMNPHDEKLPNSGELFADPEAHADWADVWRGLGRTAERPE